MYSGELEVQAKRKTLAILRDEIGKILNSARELSSLSKCITENRSQDAELSLARMQVAEEEVDDLRRRVTREIAKIGSLMVYREDVLRTVYIMDDVAGYISGVAFRLASLKADAIIMGRFAEGINELIGMVVDATFKLNEMARALSISPFSTIELAQEVQNLERLIDDRHRSLIIEAMNEIPLSKDLLLLKDVIEGIEGMADKCQEASDSLTILALSM